MDVGRGSPGVTGNHWLIGPSQFDRTDWLPGPGFSLPSSIPVEQGTLTVSTSNPNTSSSLNSDSTNSSNSTSTGTDSPNVDTSFLRIHEISDSNQPVIDPFSAEKFSLLGNAIGLTEGMRVLDLACGKAEMLCRWAIEHRIVGTGVDLSAVFHAAGRARIAELGVEDRITLIRGDAGGYVAAEPCDVAACIGATWIGDGVEGTIDLLRRSLRPGGLILIGEPYWRIEPTPQMLADRNVQAGEWSSLGELADRFIAHGYDLVEMVLGNQDDWDRYAAASWMNLRRWLDEHPGDEFAPTVRKSLDRSVRNHTHFQREHLGWGVFVLKAR